MATSTQNSSVNKPIIIGCQPAFNINSYEDAVAHYVDWLGFNLDWEWRSEPNKPVIISVTRDGLSLFLIEGDDTAATRLLVRVSNLQGLVDEWNKKRPESVKIVVEPPYEIPTAYIEDPFGNVMAIEQVQSEEETAEHKATGERIRQYLKTLLDSGSSRPTPQEVVNAIGGSLGIASEVLGEFREWKYKS